MLDCYDGGTCRNDDLQDELHRLTVQRDALLQALQSTRTNIEVMVSEGIIEYYSFEVIDAAIASVEGEK